MDRHTGRFVDHNDIFILVHDIKRKVRWRNLPGAFGFADAYTEMVAGGKSLAHIIVNAVNKDALGHPFDLCKILAGITAPS